MIAYRILTEYFWKFQWKIALWECCQYAQLDIIFISLLMHKLISCVYDTARSLRWTSTYHFIAPCNRILKMTVMFFCFLSCGSRKIYFVLRTSTDSQRAVTILIHIIYTMLFPINEESNLGFVHFSTLVLLNWGCWKV